MSEAETMSETPKAILIATDLSARCDRALDRAVQLADEWQARLVVLHVVEEAGALEAMFDPTPDGSEADRLRVARRALIRDIGAVAETATLVVERGQPADAIIRVAREEGCGLIVLGIARDEPFGRYSLGSTDDRLLRGAPAPLLIVKERAADPYRRIAVATDFSDSARHALDAALRLFGDRRLTLLHAFDPPMENLAPDRSVYVRDARTAAIAEAMVFAEGSTWPAAAPEPDIVAEHGRPAEVLRDYVEAGRADLVVLGTHGRSAVYEIFLGSTARRILDRLPCDALVVREPRAAHED